VYRVLSSVHTTCVHGPCPWAVPSTGRSNGTAREHGCHVYGPWTRASFWTPEFTGHGHGCHFLTSVSTVHGSYPRPVDSDVIFDTRIHGPWTLDMGSVYRALGLVRLPATHAEVQAHYLTIRFDNEWTTCGDKLNTRLAYTEPKWKIGEKYLTIKVKDNALYTFHEQLLSSTFSKYIITHRRSIAKGGGCFQRRLFV